MAETVRDEITQLAGSIRALERQLEVALAKRRVELNYVVHDGIVRFEHVMIAKHRLLKARLLSYILGARRAELRSRRILYGHRHSTGRRQSGHCRGSWRRDRIRAAVAPA